MKGEHKNGEGLGQTQIETNQTGCGAVLYALPGDQRSKADQGRLGPGPVPEHCRVGLHRGVAPFLLHQAGVNDGRGAGRARRPAHLRKTGASGFVADWGGRAKLAGAPPPLFL